MNEPSSQVAPAPAPAAYAPPQDLGRLQRVALPVAAVGGVLCVLGAVLDPTQFFRAYLIAFVFWTSIALGCLGLVMIQHVATGAWGVMLRRPLEAAARTLPYLGLLFVPLLFGLKRLYLWAQPERVLADHLLHHKEPYLNVRFFIGRAVFYFVAWTAVAYVLSRLSLAQDTTGDPSLSRRMRRASAAGLLVYGLTITFASIDWLMSLSPHWYSTIYGIYIVGGQAVSAMAFSIAIAVFLSRRQPMSAAYEARHFHDWGKLLFAFLMLWAYFGLSQFLIIWSGNLPEETPFYLDRVQGGWRWVSLALIVFHFALPFLLLLQRRLKQRPTQLAAIAVMLLVMRWVDYFWLVTPTFHPGQLRVHWVDIGAMALLGGVWLWLFTGELKKRSLLPVQDPILKEALGHG